MKKIILTIKTNKLWLIVKVLKDQKDLLKSALQGKESEQNLLTGITPIVVAYAFKNKLYG